MFNFSIAPEPIEDIDHEYMEKVQHTNALFRLLQRGYSHHVPITIRPDDILNTIVCIWAKYIVLNAEKFRDFFVNHEGKKTLTYQSGGTFADNRLQEFMDGLIVLIKEDQDNDNLSWAEYLSSVTIPSDHLVRSAAMLASQKEYYEYRIHLACGFSQVRLEGDDDDWDALELAVLSMPLPDSHLLNWQLRLVNTIREMRTGAEEFWQRCMVQQGFGSGPQDYDGWILDFNPINEKGEWMETMEDDDILNLTVDFDLNVNDNGNEFELKVEAGPTRMVDRDGMLAVANAFELVLEAGGTLRPATSPPNNDGEDATV